MLSLLKYHPHYHHHHHNHHQNITIIKGMFENIIAIAVQNIIKAPFVCWKVVSF
jgi:hypothetical protein